MDFFFFFSPVSIDSLVELIHCVADVPFFCIWCRWWSRWYLRTCMWMYVLGCTESLLMYMYFWSDCCSLDVCMYVLHLGACTGWLVFLAVYRVTGISPAVWCWLRIISIVVSESCLTLVGWCSSGLCINWTLWTAVFSQCKYDVHELVSCYWFNSGSNEFFV